MSGVAQTTAVRGLANLEVLDATLRELAAGDPAIRVLTADSRISGKLVPFAQEYPQRMVEIGIAEQNLVGVAAGLASCGKKPFVISPACFLTARSLEQIKVDVSYGRNAVRLIGISAGISYGPLGASHHSIADFAALRAMPGIPVIAPGDNCETAAAIRYAADADGPVYVRLGKRQVGCFHPEGTGPVVVDRATLLRDGSDVAIIATGETVQIALDSADLLEARGLAASVLSVPMVRPLDADAVLAAGARARCVIVVEEHSVHGGLGEACALVLAHGGMARPFRALGIPDEPIVNGDQLEVLAHYGIDAEGLTCVAESLLGSRDGGL